MELYYRTMDFPLNKNLGSIIDKNVWAYRYIDQS